MSQLSYITPGNESIEVKRQYIEELHNKIDSLEEALVIQSQENCVLLDSIQKLEDQFVGSLLIRDENIDTRISPELTRAFKRYEELKGPEVTITSLRRSSTPKSRHFTGDAADIRLDRGGIRFLQWIKSTPGIQWINEHRIEVLLEFPHENESFHEFASKYPFTIVNQKATGVHIHIHIKNNEMP